MTLIKESKTKDFIDKYLLSDVIFTALILFMTFLTSVPYLQYHLNKYYKFILAYGVLVILWTLVTGKLIPLIWKRKSNLLLVAFSFSYLITIFLNRDSYLVGNLKQLMYMITFFIILYIMQQGKTKEQLLKQIKAFSAIIVGVTFVLANICYRMYVDGFYYEYTVGTQIGVLGRIGDELYGLYNPNTCGSFCVVSIVISIGYLYSSCNKIFRYREKLAYNCAYIIFNGYNIFLQYRCLLPTNSRTSRYSLYIVVFILLLALSLKGLIKWNKVRNEEYYLLTVPISSYVMKSENLNLTIGSLDFYLSGRDIIWHECLEVFVGDPLFGSTNLKAISTAVKLAESQNLDLVAYDLKYGGMHNIYLTVLSASGMVGFTLLAAFFLMIFINVVRRFIRQRTIGSEILTSLSLVVMILISEFFEARILYAITLFAVIFWLYLGYMVAFMRIDSRK